MNQIVEMAATIEAEFCFNGDVPELLSVHIYPDMGDLIEVPADKLSEKTKALLESKATKQFNQERVIYEISKRESYCKEGE